MSADLIPRVTLDALLGHRDRALILAAEARACHVATLEKIKEARAAAQSAATGEYVLGDLEKWVLSEYTSAEQFATFVRAGVDKAIWPSILTMTGLGGMMDKQTRDEFERDLASDPPECTADNIRATFSQLRQDAHRIFRRGLVNVFKNLSRDYRSNDGFKLGARTVIYYGVGDYREYHAFADADRIMQVLDGVKVGPGWYSTLSEQLRQKVQKEYRRASKYSSTIKDVVVPGELTTAYWKVKWFQNRNVHLWCLRPDLLRRANRLIAEHYGEVVGEGPDAAGARQYQRAKPHHHEVEDFYPTPPAVVAAMIDAADLSPGQDVLEPSAGDGAIVQGIIEAGINPDCVEADPGRAETLRDMLPPGAVVCMDFLRMHAEPEYDRVLMNPPFGQGAGVAHVFHAMRFLKPGGRLVAILGVGMEYRQDGPTQELRGLVEAWGGTIERLPPGSFKASGTMTDAVMLCVSKPSGAVAALPAPDAEAA